MDDAFARGHSVDRARFGPLHHSGAVAVHHRAFEPTGKCRWPAMRVRANIVVVARLPATLPPATAAAR